MKKTVKIQVTKQSSKSLLTEYSTDFSVTSATTVSELKQIIKDSINQPIDLVSESLWDSGKELENSKVLPKSQYLNYYLETK